MNPHSEVVEAPIITLRTSQRPKPTVTNFKFSIGEAPATILNTGGNTCGVTTHSFVIMPRIRLKGNFTH